jgi:hypothetical protein
MTQRAEALAEARTGSFHGDLARTSAIALLHETDQ